MVVGLKERKREIQVDACVFNHVYKWFSMSNQE